MFTERCRKRLALQKKNGLYRSPPRIEQRNGKHIVLGSRTVLNFASNDYLGLGGSTSLARQVAKNFEKLGSSASSSRLVSGNYTLINEAEAAYADHFGYESALFFPSGYQANLGVLTSLFDPEDTLFFDKHVHASMVKGLSLSRATYSGYNHNQMNHLEKRLKKDKSSRTAVVTESLFSMDGDYLDLSGFARLKKAFGFLSIIDEAHAFGAIGEEGRGLAEDVADIAVGTFGKALGLFGAFALLPAIYKEYLYNFSSPLIYTTSLPAAHAASAIDVLAFIAESNDRRKNLKMVSALMKRCLHEAGFDIKGDAQIVAIQVGNETKAVRIARYLLEHDIYVLPARYPTVPLNRAILRIGVTAEHTENDIRLFVNTLKDAYAKLK